MNAVGSYAIPFFSSFHPIVVVVVVVDVAVAVAVHLSVKYCARESRQRLRFDVYCCASYFSIQVADCMSQFCVVM